MSHVMHLNSSNFDEQTSSGVVLLDFWAEWCGPCKMLSSILDEVSDEFAGSVKVVKVNVDEAADIAKRFVVRSVPTLFILQDGEIVRQLPGTQDKGAIVSALESL